MNKCNDDALGNTVIPVIPLGALSLAPRNKIQDLSYWARLQYINLLFVLSFTPPCHI